MSANSLQISAQPYPFRCDLAHTALVIIDMQRDFLEPGGFGASLGNDVSGVRAILPTLQILLAAWRQASGLVIHTRESHLPDLADCPPAKRLRGEAPLRIGDRGPMGRILVRGEPGNQIVPELAPIDGEWQIDKPGKGAFHATDLQARLQAAGITHLLFTGVTTEVCVQTSMREANDRGYECLLVTDATESYFPQFRDATIAMVVAQGGIVGWAAASNAVLAALPAGSTSGRSNAV